MVVSGGTFRVLFVGGQSDFPGGNSIFFCGRGEAPTVRQILLFLVYTYPTILIQIT